MRHAAPSHQRTILTSAMAAGRANTACPQPDSAAQHTIAGPGSQAAQRGLCVVIGPFAISPAREEGRPFGCSLPETLRVVCPAAAGRTGGATRVLLSAHPFFRAESARRGSLRIPPWCHCATIPADPNNAALPGPFSPCRAGWQQGEPFAIRRGLRVRHSGSGYAIVPAGCAWSGFAFAFCEYGKGAPWAKAWVGKPV